MEPQIWLWHRSKKISIFSVSSGILNSDFRQRSQDANMGTEAISSALRLELRPGEWVFWDARPHRFESLVQGRARIRDASGSLRRDLTRSVTSPMLYAYEGIPSALRPEDVEQVLSITRQHRTVGGLRDYAVLLLLATYGLRAGEITSLRLEDID